MYYNFKNVQFLSSIDSTDDIVELLSFDYNCFVTNLYVY